MLLTAPSGLTRQFAWTGALAIVVGLLSGCAAPPESTFEAGSESDVLSPVSVDFSESTGGIEGLVTDDSLIPLEGATIVLDGSDQTVSNHIGAFGFSFVAPGTHTMTVSLDGYRDAQMDVLVEAGAVAGANVVLEPFTGVEPYHETRTLAGYLMCGVGFKSPAYADNPALCAVPTLVDDSGTVERFRTDFPLGVWEASWRGVWLETAWKSTQAFGTHMNLVWFIANSAANLDDVPTLESTRVAAARGPSPQGLPVPSDEMYDREGEGGTRLCNEKVPCWLLGYHYNGREGLGSGDVTAGVTLMQRYDDYVTLFHWGELPEKFSILPDD